MLIKNIKKENIMSKMGKIESAFSSAGVQPQLIQGIRRRDGVGEGQETTA